MAFYQDYWMARWLRLMLCVVICLGAQTLHAGTTGKIAGKVTDAQTDEPLPGANIVVEGTTFGAASDGSGDYFIANLPPGVYTVKATMIGFKTVIVKQVRVRIDVTTELDIALDETVVELGGEVTVTAQRPLVEKHNTSTRVIMETQEIEARPTTQFTSVLASLPSINMDNGELRIRGGGVNEVAFMIDGARAQNPLNQNPYTNINLSSIQELEVITGSFNAEYGEAQSGVINIVTKEGSDDYRFFTDVRYTPPGRRHWGVALYDRNTDLYWENSHARHLEWWIEHPDQWVDPNGIPGIDPRSVWTPEQAYQNYLDTHQPLTDYTSTPSYQTETSISGPVPFVNNTYFFVSGRYRSQAPLFGNAFRDRGEFFDGTAKLTFKLSGNMKLQLSGFFGSEETSWGVEGPPDFFYAQNFGVDSRYAFFDFPGFPTTRTDGQTLRFTHVLNTKSMYEIKLSRVAAKRKVDVFPGDPIGFDAADATRDNLRAVDENGNPIPGGFANRIGFHTTGYFFRFDDFNTEWNFKGDFNSQINKSWELKTGLHLTAYDLDHFNQSKLPDRTDDNVYKPYQGALYFQNKLEFGGLIANAGLRLDFYDPNEVVFEDLFDPLNGPTRDAKTFAQLSPRLGISHPIDERTVLHFSYGHFFQRAPFGDTGEGNSPDEQLGSLTTFIVDDSSSFWVLGNRELEPRKTVAYEVGVERNFADLFVLTVTGFYKDIRNTIRSISVIGPTGTYATNGNGDYADVRGFELSLRKTPSPANFGTLWGYANFTTQQGVNGRSGEPVAISQDGVRFAPSGDFIVHNNPRLKAGLFYETPANWTFLKGALKDISLSLEYQAVFPNADLLQDFFVFEGKKHLRDPDQNVDLRLSKEIFLSRPNIHIRPYIEVTNLFNHQWLNLSAFERASRADQRRFVESDFEFLPSEDANGAPIVGLAKFRNIRRTVLFGFTFEL